jgi:glycosyltransferase involved in cell wall biosynthesis
MHKIAISANSSWYIFNFRQNTIRELLRCGYEVIVIAPLDNYSKRLIELGCSFIQINIEQKGKNPFKDLITIYQFWKIYKGSHIDVVLNFTPKNNIYSTISAYASGTKAINNIAGLGVVFIKKNLLSYIVRFLYKISQNKASILFFQNEDDQKIFADYKIARNVSHYRLPGSGVDLSRFHVVNAKDDGVVRFLLVARMLYEKGIEHFVEAARILKKKYGDKVELNLLGFIDENNPSSVSNSQILEWVKEGVINYLGVSDCVENQIALADCVVLPSYYREGVPRSLLEAGAMGKPIVTSDNVGCRDCVVDSINGFLCQPQSTESLVAKMELMCMMGYKGRIEMGRKSRQKIEDEFDENIVIKRYITAIKDCLNSISME